MPAASLVASRPRSRPAGAEGRRRQAARSEAEAEQRASEILGHRTSRGTRCARPDRRRAEIDSEFYFSILLDRAERRYLAMCSREGGMDIETLAKERPEALARVAIAPLIGLSGDVAASIVEAAGFEPGSTADRIAEVITRLWEVFTAEDATLVEVNPPRAHHRRHRPGPGRQGHAR